MCPGGIDANSKGSGGPFGAQAIRNEMCDTSLSVRKAKHRLSDGQAVIDKPGAIELEVGDTIAHQDVYDGNPTIIGFAENGRIVKWSASHVLKISNLIKPMITGSLSYGVECH
jgi:hypothetical protein